MEIVKYSLESSLGNKYTADRALERSKKLVGFIKDELKQRLYLSKIDLCQTWHKGVYGSPEDAIKIRRSSIEANQQL